MSATILVAFATKYGSTQEVAETIAATLREAGTAVDCQPVKQVKNARRVRRGRVGGAALYVPLAQRRQEFSLAASTSPYGAAGGGLCDGATER